MADATLSGGTKTGTKPTNTNNFIGVMAEWLKAADY